MKKVLVVLVGWHVIMLALYSVLPLFGVEALRFGALSIEPKPNRSILVLVLSGMALYLFDRSKNSKVPLGSLFAPSKPRWWWPKGRSDD